MCCGEVGDVVGGEERRGDDKEGYGVECRLLGEGVVEVGCTKGSLLEGVCAREG